MHRDGMRCDAMGEIVFKRKQNGFDCMFSSAHSNLAYSWCYNMTLSSLHIQYSCNNMKFRYMRTFWMQSIIYSARLWMDKRVQQWCVLRWQGSSGIYPLTTMGYVAATISLSSVCIGSRWVGLWIDFENETENASPNSKIFWKIGI